MAKTELQKYEKYGESRMTELITNDLTSKRDLHGELKLSACSQAPPAIDSQTLAHSTLFLASNLLQLLNH